MASSSTSLTRPSSSSFNPKFTRPNLHLPRLRKALSFVLLLACLATTALAQTETQHPDITSSSSLAVPASTHVSDGGVESEMAANANWNRLRKQLRKRKDAETESSTTTKGTETKKGSATTTTLTISIEQATASSSNSSPLPQPFDGNLASEYSSTAGSKCPAFLNSLLASPSFEACYPLSMLVQTSRGFFDAEKQLSSIVRVLDATCAANVTYCTDYLSTAAKNLTATENCKAEWNKGDATVKQVLYGLKAYEMMYKASCLQNPSNDMYCFANAVTNLTTPSDAYFYYLPYNLSLPGSSVPSCSWCIEETMAIFHAASVDRSQVISNTYEAAARQVNTLCGLNFVNATLPKAEASSSPLILPPSVGIVITMLGAALFTMFL